MSKPERYTSRELTHRIEFNKLAIEGRPGETLILGRNDFGITDRDVLENLADAGVSSTHFALDFSNQSITLRPLTKQEAGGKNKANIYFNGSVIKEKGVVLMSGNEIRIRTLVFRVTVGQDGKSVLFDRFKIVPNVTTEKLSANKNITLPQKEHGKGIVVVDKDYINQRGLDTKGLTDKFLSIIGSYDSTIDLMTYQMVPAAEVEVFVLRRGSERYVTAQDYFELQDQDQLKIGEHFFTVDLEQGILEYTASL